MAVRNYPVEMKFTRIGKHKMKEHKLGISINILFKPMNYCVLIFGFDFTLNYVDFVIELYPFIIMNNLETIINNCYSITLLKILDNCYFQAVWLEEPDWKMWLHEVFPHVTTFSSCFLQLPCIFCTL